MNKDSLNPEYIHFSDIKKFLRKKKKLFFLAASITFLIALLFLSLKQPLYYATATFKEADVKTESLSSNFLKKLITDSMQKEIGTYAQMLMLSKHLLYKTIKKLSMQGTLSEKGFLKNISYRIQDQWLNACNLTLQKRNLPEINFLDYQGETKKTFLLEIINSQTLLLKSLKGDLLLEFQPGDNVSYKDLSFALTLPENITFPALYKLRVSPLKQTYEDLLKRLQIKVKKDEQKLLDLSFSHRDRFLVSKFLNTHMKTYKNYLKNEHERLSEEQLTFLSKRQKDIGENLDQSLAEYKNYIKNQYGDEGFLTLVQQLTVLDDRKRQHLDKLFNIELQLSQFESKSQIETEGMPLDPSQQELQKRVNQLKKRKKSLELYKIFQKQKFSRARPLQSGVDPVITKVLYQHNNRIDNKLCQSEKCVLPIFEYVKTALSDLRIRQKQIHKEAKTQEFFQKFEEKAKNIESLNQLKTDAKKLLHQIEKGHILDVEKTTFFDSFSCSDVNQSQTKKNLFKNFLINFMDLVSLKQQAQHDSLYLDVSGSNEFSGLDLESTDKLYFQNMEELDTIRFDKNKVSLALEKITKKDFEMSSLSHLSSSSVDQEMFLTLAKLYHTLRDKPNLTSKDQERLNRKISFESERLKKHLEYQKELLVMQEGLTREKIELIKAVQLEQIGQEIVVYQQQLAEAINQKVLALHQEKQYLTQKLKDISNIMKSMPEKWLLENKLQFSTDLNLSIMEGITHLVESKSIDHHLLHIESKPIDYAEVPLKPKNNHLWLFSSLGGLFGGLVFITFLLMRQIYRGLPLSLKGIKNRELQAFGEISSDCNTKDFSALSQKDLTVIRHLAQFCAGQSVSKCVGCLINGDVNYTKALSHILAMSGKKVLLVETFFQKTNESGLIQYMLDKTKNPQIVSRGKFDVLPLGGQTAFVPELLAREKFSKLIKTYEQSYDLIFLVTKEGPKSPIARGLLDKVSKIMITLDEETIDDLYPYITWVKANSNYQLGFVANTI